MRLGIAVEQAAQPVQMTPTPLIQTYGRFEVKDADGNYIPGASVTLTMDNGEFLLNKLSDAGGNVSVTPDEMATAADNLKTRPTEKSKVMFAVSAPGTNTKSGLFYDGSKRTASQLAIHSVTLYKPDDIRAYLPYIGIGAGVLVVGGLAWYFLRK